MSITLGALQIGLNSSMGTSETNLYTSDKRIRAINRAVETILEQYPIPQYLIDTTLSFSSGLVSIPTDCLRAVKLFTSSNGNVQEWKIVNPDDFDNNIYQTAKIYWDTSSSLEKIKIYPASSTSINFRYVQIPTYMSASSDTVRFYQRWSDVICEQAAYFLFLDSQNYTGAQAKKQSAADLMAKAWQVENARYQSPYENTLESVFEHKKSLLGGRDYLYNNSIALMGVQDVTWVNQDTDTVMIAGSGYVTNSASRVTLTLPQTASFGDTVKVQGFGDGGWKVAQNAGQYIRFGIQATTTGTGGYLQSTNKNDSLTLVCVSENLGWEVQAPVGAITYV